MSNDSSFPIFDESFEFLINLPELALVRFVVLDDEFIGDDFVGQCTIPFDCIQTGRWPPRSLGPKAFFCGLTLSLLLAVVVVLVRSK